MAASLTLGRSRVGRLLVKIDQTKVLSCFRHRSFIKLCQQHQQQKAGFCFYNFRELNSARSSITTSLQRTFSTSPQQEDVKKIVQFKLSDIGEGIREVVVKAWLVKVGDRVSQFDGICEVESDKASVMITSRYDGIVTKLYYGQDETALVGLPLVDIELDDGENFVPSVEENEVAESKKESDSESSSSDEEDHSAYSHKVLATPAVRNLAAQNKVKLRDVKGSGKHGRILKDDVFAYLKTKISLKPDSAAHAAIPEVKPALPEIPEPLPKAVPLFSVASRIAGAAEDRIEPITGIKKVMVKSMTAANAVPHFCLCDEIDLSKLIELRPVFKEVAQRYGIKFSYTPFFVKAASMALLEYPILNCVVDTECKNITYKGSHNIGIAMDTSRGLMVPNIKNVEQLSVLQVASELNRLVQLGNSGKLGPSELTGGTFTLSNIGMIGGTYTKPVIFVPEVVIGALGSIKKLPRFDETDKVVPAHVMNISWSADHRIIDGATMARFSNLWKSYLENPATLLLHLR